MYDGLMWYFNIIIILQICIYRRLLLLIIKIKFELQLKQKEKHGPVKQKEKHGLVVVVPGRF